MKKTAILLSLTILTGVLFSACSLIQEEEDMPANNTDNGASVDLSVDVLPEGEVMEDEPSVSIPLAVVVE